MPQVQTLSQTAVQNRKAETLNAQALRKTVAIRDIEIVSETALDFQGRRLEMTTDAFKQLIKMVGMSKAFVKKFESLFDTDVKARFINHMKNAMASQLNEITMVVSPSTKRVVGFNQKPTDLISNQRFVDLAERIIDQHGFEVTNWGTDAQKGTVIINAFNPDNEFEIQGMSNEVFKSGLTMRNSPNKGIEVMPYANRLWCANGFSTPMAEETYRLEDLSQPKMEKFFQHMQELSRAGFQPNGFQDLVKRADQTPASLNELRRGHSMIKRHVGDAAEQWIPLGHNMQAYRQAGIEADEFNLDKLKNARSNQSVWSLFNSITHVATHGQERLAFDMTDRDSTRLMVDAGNIIGKKWDLGAQVPSPFEGPLNPDEQVGVYLN